MARALFVFCPIETFNWPSQCRDAAARYFLLQATNGTISSPSCYIGVTEGHFDHMIF